MRQATLYCALFCLSVCAGCATRSGNSGRPADLSRKGVPAIAENTSDTISYRWTVPWETFEAPDPRIAWLPVAATKHNAHAFIAGPPGRYNLPRSVYRTPDHPYRGLWSMRAKIHAAGSLYHRFRRPANLFQLPRRFDALEGVPDPTTALPAIFATFTRESSGTRHSGLLTARDFLIDAKGKMFLGDAYPVLNTWQRTPLDLSAAAKSGLDMKHIAAMGVSFFRTRPGKSPSIIVQSDQWTLGFGYDRMAGHRLGFANRFFVQAAGLRLRVGVTKQFEMDFTQRSGWAKPWLQVFQGPHGPALGGRGAGLMLLGQSQYKYLRGKVHATPQPVLVPGLHAAWPAQRILAPWPGSACISRWKCVWKSPIAALVVVRQSFLPLDRFGRPARVLRWQFMIYATGQVYATVSWTGPKGVVLPPPVALALATDLNQYRFQKPTPDRVLLPIYPPGTNARLLPNNFQPGAPVAMLGKWGHRGIPRMWCANTLDDRWLGMKTPQSLRNGPLHFMLLLDWPNALKQAADFSAYLRPPVVKMRWGRLRRHYPGDFENDSMVDPLGLQVIALKHGHAIFTVVPGGRPLLSPAFLFVTDKTGSGESPASRPVPPRVRVNVAGELFKHLPAFRDGRLFVVPFPLTRRVHMEVALRRR